MVFDGRQRMVCKLNAAKTSSSFSLKIYPHSSKPYLGSKVFLYFSGSVVENVVRKVLIANQSYEIIVVVKNIIVENVTVFFSRQIIIHQACAFQSEVAEYFHAQMPCLVEVSHSLSHLGRKTIAYSMASLIEDVELDEYELKRFFGRAEGLKRESLRKKGE